MKKTATLILSFFTLTAMTQTKGVNPVVSGKKADSGITRAVIAGISDYQNEQITDLQYADVDATAYADYLMSVDGGNIDSSNITLLLNQDATAGNFITALYDLMEKTQKGDQAIIYFSGHGDVETTTMNQPGFLLLWDAPSRVYFAGGTFGLAYLQEVISTLSTGKEAKVVVVTDACRAGKLAGSRIGGAQATAAHLANQYSNEVKIMSCQPDEFSLEGKSWGGGRGVFSYYFLKGLRGAADKNHDGEVTLAEIERYLGDQVPVATDPHPQSPLTRGTKKTVLAQVSENYVEEVEATHEMMRTEERSLNLGLEATADSNIVRQFDLFKKALAEKHLLYPEEGSAWNLFQVLKDEPELELYVGLMKRNLAAALQDEAQQAINKYLASDPEDFKLRWAFDHKYETYPEYLYHAAALLGEYHFYYGPIMARAHYFEGLGLRLRAEENLTGNADSLILLAMEKQEKALEFQADAPFALNELGYNNFLLGRYDEAIGHYEAALLNAPEWTLPWANLAGSYCEKKDIVKAKECANKAIALDPKFAIGRYNLALAHYYDREYEVAITLAQELLADFPDYHVAMYLLGMNYYRTKQLKKSEEWINKYLASNANDLEAVLTLGHVQLELKEWKKAENSFLRARTIAPDSEKAIQGMIEFSYYTGDMNKAETALSDYLELYPADGFGYYLLSSCQAKLNKADESLGNLKSAFENGFKEWETLKKDANFDPFRESDAYLSLVRQYMQEK